MRIREAQKHKDPTDPNPQHCLLVYHDEGFEEAEGDVVMEEGEDEAKAKKKEKTEKKKKKKKDAVETAGGKSTSGAISKVTKINAVIQHRVDADPDRTFTFVADPDPDLNPDAIPIYTQVGTKEFFV
jgi:hypothetical protein